MITDDVEFTFLDFEASSIGGYPIEVGWARLPGKFKIAEAAIVSHGFLIRPDERWLADPDFRWDPAAEALHGISMNQLMAEGISREDACDRISQEFRHDAIYVDSITLDIHWMDVLFARESWFFDIVHWGHLFGRLWPDPESDAMKAARMAQQALPRPHRARLDAIRLALIFAAAWESEGWNLEGA